MAALALQLSFTGLHPYAFPSYKRLRMIVLMMMITIMKMMMMMMMMTMMMIMMTTMMLTSPGQSLPPQF